MHTRTGLPPFKAQEHTLTDAAAAHDIADTAFWVNVSRAKLLDVSRDTWAHLWVTPGSEALWDEMSREVYPHSDLSVSLRNRFYLERMQAFVQGGGIGVANIAAGFTAYPFLLPESCPFLEIDYPKVVDFKRERTDAWQADGTLPRREVAYLGADLALEEDLYRVRDGISRLFGLDKGFVLMEGITYYLPRKSLDTLFATLADVLPKGSLLAFEHWPPDADDYPVFARFKRHLNERFGWTDHGFNLISDRDAANVPGFTLAEAHDYAQVEAMYTDSKVMQSRDTHFPALFKVLVRG